MALENLARTDSPAALVAIEIRKLLGARNQSQAALARAVGEAPMWLSQRLNGTVQMTFNDLAKIAEALGVTIVTLLPSSERVPTGTYGNDPISAAQQGVPPAMTVGVGSRWSPPPAPAKTIPGPRVRTQLTGF